MAPSTNEEAMNLRSLMERYRQRRRALTELRQLSAAELRDLGIGAGEAPYWAEVAGPDAREARTDPAQSATAAPAPQSAHDVPDPARRTAVLRPRPL